MTDREIERLERSLPRWKNGEPPVRTGEQQRLMEELHCRNMINSVLCYYWPCNLLENRYIAEYSQKLGQETVEVLCKEQLEDFMKAVVLKDVSRDTDGLSYNSVVWADVMVEDALDVIENDLAAEGPENGTGYTLPDGKYHIFAYVDFIDDDRVIVLEPNKVVDGAHEPIAGDTYIVAFGDMEELRKGCDWCLAEFAKDRYGIDAVLQRAAERSVAGTRTQVLETRDGMSK